MGIQLGKKKGSISEPNVVPLIDVLLVLIIIFMAITPTAPTGMAAQIPQPPPKSVRPPASADSTVVVQIAADGKVKINQTDTSWANLGPQLTDIFKTRAEKVAFVQGDDNTSFKLVARAIDVMRGSGISNIGLMASRLETEQ